MNHKTLAIASVAIAGLLGAASAQAGGRDDVRWSISIGSPAWSQPVYGPVHSPVYGPSHVVRSYGHDHRGHHAPRRWDRDGDGIPNRYDRAYTPRWDRDGDGIPNRYDRHPNRPDYRHGHGGWR